jgi:hypothetical protein
MLLELENSNGAAHKTGQALYMYDDIIDSQSSEIGRPANLRSLCDFSQCYEPWSGKCQQRGHGPPRGIDLGLILLMPCMAMDPFDSRQTKPKSSSCLGQ